jgi:hypothetical protein
MVLDVDSSRSAQPDRQHPFITPVPMDAVITAAKEWQGVDQRLTASQTALDGAVSKMRQALRSASLAADETAGAQVATIDDAISALDGSRQALNAATKARTQALAALEEARSQSDVPLRQAADVLLARRAIFAIIVLLLLVAGYMMFGRVLLG